MKTSEKNLLFLLVVYVIVTGMLSNIFIGLSYLIALYIAVNILTSGTKKESSVIITKDDPYIGAEGKIIDLLNVNGNMYYYSGKCDNGNNVIVMITHESHVTPNRFKITKIVDSNFYAEITD